MNRRKLLTWLIGTLLVLIGVVAGLVAGVLVAAPTATDIRNACVADAVVPRAGLPPGVAPGPASDPYSDPRTISSTPQPERGPFPRHRTDPPATTPQVVTPLSRP